MGAQLKLFLQLIIYMRICAGMNVDNLKAKGLEDDPQLPIAGSRLYTLLETEAILENLKGD